MKTGILFNDFTKSDKNYHIMTSLNHEVENTTDEVCGFLLNVSPKVIQTNFAYVNVSDISHFNGGLLIATSLDTADCLRKTSVNAKKCFYLWNLEWLGKSFNFYGVYKLLSSPKIKTIVRSQLQADVIKNNFNIKVSAINEGFNLEEIHEVCKRE